MIKFDRVVLDNGLTVLYHQDINATILSMNLIYKVGSRNESPDKTGLAHLFEHLMFEGSQYGASFDSILELAGGECNAFTNADMTNYYNLVPLDNMDTAFYLESMRMRGLSLQPHEIENQRSVVIEEFKETCLNIPYGDSYHDILKLNYDHYSYAWPVIGKTIDGIRELKYEDFISFYNRHYRPDNAILSLTSALSWDEIREKVENYFGQINTEETFKPTIFKEEPQRAQARRSTVSKQIPKESITMAWLMPDRLHADYYAVDLLSDVLATGRDSRLFKDLVKDKQIAHSADAYITGAIGPGLFIVEAKPADGVTLEELELEIYTHIKSLRNREIKQSEIDKHLLRIENGMLFGENDPMNKSMNLGYFEMLGDAHLINAELDNYKSLTLDHLHQAAHDYLAPDRVAVLYEVPE